MPIVSGTSNDDVLSGSAKSDTLIGLEGADRLFGKGGRDGLFGGAGDDTLRGGAGGDMLFGEDGDDSLSGGGGADIIVGGLGRDLLLGGAGADVFRFGAEDTGDSTGNLHDAIGDFSADDVIDLTTVELREFGGGYFATPERGMFSVWQALGNTYVTWNTGGTYHDLELTGYTGDPYELVNQIRWYDDDFSQGVNTNGRIEAGETVDGAIETSNDQDWFEIEMEADRLYAFDLTDMTLTNAYVTLYDADGTYLTETYFYEDGSGSGPLQYAGVGTFYVGVSGWQTGTYSLEATAEPISDVPGGTGTSAEIEIGDTIAGEIQFAADQDWFRIEMVDGQFYAFDLTDLTLSQANLTLYDAYGNYLAEIYYYDGSSSGPLQYAGVGTFYVGVSGWQTGSYTLEATAEPFSDVPEGPDTDADISAGETINEAIEFAGDRDWFRIEMVEGESYRFILRGERGGFGTLADPYLELYDAEGNVIASDDDGGAGTNARLDHAVMATGTYFVAAGGNWDYVGTYELVARTLEPVEPLIG